MTSGDYAVLDTSKNRLDALERALAVSESRYESVERSYKSIADWLRRPDSGLAGVDANVYVQGSFRLGTPIRPLSGAEDYDLDVVCEIQHPKYAITQIGLQAIFHAEIESYAKAHGMEQPQRWERCSTLNYADGAQFHMDLLPCLPDGAAQLSLIKAAGFHVPLGLDAVAITDAKHRNFRRISPDWPVSNPNGYARWFESRMNAVFEINKALMEKSAKIAVSDIPRYRVRTPLQTSIQILKRHRDMRFSESAEMRPSSIAVTTLAALAYRNELDLASAIRNILSGMAGFIEMKAGAWWIPNPTDPRENFADAWTEKPALRDAFLDWLETARLDFDAALAQSDVHGFIDVLGPRMGRPLLESTFEPLIKSASQGSVSRVVRKRDPKLEAVTNAPHRKPLRWPTVAGPEVVSIVDAICRRNGFRDEKFRSDSGPIPKECSLEFQAETSVAKPFRVFWQVVNLGHDARVANGLRGGFDDGEIVRGKLTRTERTSYRGSHSIECIIVKDEKCVARSGPFIVNIAGW